MDKTECAGAWISAFRQSWRPFILKKKSSGPSTGKPSKRSLELLFRARDDIDRFGQFVASDGFSDIYDLPAQELKDILCDDVALMQFGFRLLRQVLFGEESITLRQEAAEQRRLRHLERRQRIETEAAARRALEQDEMYRDPDA